MVKIIKEEFIIPNQLWTETRKRKKFHKNMQERLKEKAQKKQKIQKVQNKKVEMN